MSRHGYVCVLVAVLTMSVVSGITDAAEPTVIDVWPGAVPGEQDPIGEEKLLEAKPGEKPVQRLTNVSKPTLTIYWAPAGSATGAAVLVCPGGGYNILAWDLEGTEVAAWLNKLGIAAAVLKYRVPRRPRDAKVAAPLGPLQDAQRAMSLLRSRAKEFGIDPQRIGMLGFSAGGNLTARTATQFDARSYDAIDDADQASCRPDFAVLIYPGGIVGNDKTDLAADIRVNAQTPPMFFAHAGDDRVDAENSIALYLALKKAKVPAELHIYSTGGHGFGLRPSDKPCSTWPDRCADWLRVQGVLNTRK